MKFSVLFILLFPFMLSGQDLSKNVFRIEGEVEGKKTRGKIELKFLDHDQSLVSKVRDGKFVFEGNIKYETKVRLLFNKIYSIPFYLEKSNFKVKLELIEHDKELNLPFKASWIIKDVEGNTTEQLHREFSNFESKNKQSLRYNYLLFNYLNEKISQYPNNSLYFDILYRLSFSQQHFTYVQFLSCIDKMNLTYLPPIIKSRFVDNLKKIEKYGIGRKFPHSVLETTEGKSENITKAFGKYTFIDFWASWCAPCRAKNSKIKVIYEKYKPKGFEVIGISIDKDQAKWKKAIEKDDLTWKNFHTKTLNKEFNVSFIPYTYLIDENGIIVGVNLTEKQLKFILEQRL